MLKLTNLNFMGGVEKRFILQEFGDMERARVTGDVDKLRTAIEKLKTADLSAHAMESADSLMENMELLLEKLEGGKNGSSS